MIYAAKAELHIPATMIKGNSLFLRVTSQMTMEKCCRPDPQPCNP